MDFNFFDGFLIAFVFAVVCFNIFVGFLSIEKKLTMTSTVPLFEKGPVVSTNEKKFILEALTQGFRVDGRQSLDMRQVSIDFADKHGTVEVRIGNTRVLATVTADIVAPFDNTPAEGSLNLFVDFSPMASQFFEPTKLSDKAITVARVVERNLRESNAVDMEALCILAGKKVWGIRVDLHILDHQGNLTDCCALAALTSLLSFRRPEVTVSGDRVTIHSVTERQPIPLDLHHRPVSVTFGFFHDGQVFVVDPSLEEELICEGWMSITLNNDDELCCFQKAGGVGVEAEHILDCTQIARKRSQKLLKLVDKEVKKFEARKPLIASATSAREFVDTIALEIAEREAKERGELNADSDSDTPMTESKSSANSTRATQGGLAKGWVNQVDQKTAGQGQASTATTTGEISTQAETRIETNSTSSTKKKRKRSKKAKN